MIEPSRLEDHIQKADVLGLQPLYLVVPKDVPILVVLSYIVFNIPLLRTSLAVPPLTATYLYAAIDLCVSNWMGSFNRSSSSTCQRSCRIQFCASKKVTQVGFFSGLGHSFFDFRIGVNHCTVQCLVPGVPRAYSTRYNLMLRRTDCQ